MKAGLVAGFEDDTFRPNEIITREQNEYKAQLNNLITLAATEYEQILSE
ncbi:S-layer homology domain-containing protein [Peptococcaceae bacterium]|nr:S-layer homology domain-containing protein [Peptococcaceae bacterium]MCL0068096.1 S-layer homology domain-containing protein [Peptococcaceae bacterium]